MNPHRQAGTARTHWLTPTHAKMHFMGYTLCRQKPYVDLVVSLCVASWTNERGTLKYGTEPHIIFLGVFFVTLNLLNNKLLSSCDGMRWRSICHHMVMVKWLWRNAMEEYLPSFGEGRMVVTECDGGVFAIIWWGSNGCGVAWHVQHETLSPSIQDGPPLNGSDMWYVCDMCAICNMYGVAKRPRDTKASVHC